MTDRVEDMPTCQYEAGSFSCALPYGHDGAHADKFTARPEHGLPDKPTNTPAHGYRSGEPCALDTCPDCGSRNRYSVVQRGGYVVFNCGTAFDGERVRRRGDACADIATLRAELNDMGDAVNVVDHNYREAMTALARADERAKRAEAERDELRAERDLYRTTVVAAWQCRGYPDEVNMQQLDDVLNEAVPRCETGPIEPCDCTGCDCDGTFHLPGKHCPGQEATHAG